MGFSLVLGCRIIFLSLSPDRTGGWDDVDMGFLEMVFFIPSPDRTQGVFFADMAFGFSAPNERQVDGGGRANKWMVVNNGFFLRGGFSPDRTQGAFSRTWVSWPFNLKDAVERGGRTKFFIFLFSPDRTGHLVGMDMGLTRQNDHGEMGGYRLSLFSFRGGIHTNAKCFGNPLNSIFPRLASHRPRPPTHREEF